MKKIKNEDLIVDWRTKTGYDSEKLMKDLLEKWYSDENNDKDQIAFNDENEIYFSNEDEIVAIISQHESQIQEEENAMMLIRRCIIMMMTDEFRGAFGIKIIMDLTLFCCSYTIKYSMKCLRYKLHISSRLSLKSL